jgi:hypothetical protein
MVVPPWTADIVFDACTLHVREKVRNIDESLPVEPVFRVKRYGFTQRADSIV